MDSVIDNMYNLLNPLELTFGVWCAGLVTKSILIGLLDVLILGSLYLLSYRKMPSRDPPIMKGLVELGPMDWTFLTVNQSIEFVFVCHLLNFIMTSQHVERSWESMNLINVVVPMYAILMLDDFFYYFAHRIMHMPAFYPWCHKHHHKQALPKRGYLDAANEHPMEQVIALCILWGTLQIITKTLSVHALGIFLFFILYAATAVLNHTEFDVECGILGYFYSVRAHEMHHRFPQCNYVQTFIWWDVLFGSYREYKENPNFKGAASDENNNVKSS